MAAFSIRSLRPRRVLRALVLFVGLFAAVGIAMFGAVLALAVLAVGTLVHFALCAIRGNGARRQSPARCSSARVIDGEFTVVERRAANGTPVITAPQG